MNSALIQLLVLAGVAIFLILRLRNVLGTREGFEKPPLPMPGRASSQEPLANGQTTGPGTSRAPICHAANRRRNCSFRRT